MIEATPPARLSPFCGGQRGLLPVNTEGAAAGQSGALNARRGLEVVEVADARRQRAASSPRSPAPEANGNRGPRPRPAGPARRSVIPDVGPGGLLEGRALLSGPVPEILPPSIPGGRGRYRHPRRDSGHVLPGRRWVGGA